MFHSSSQRKYWMFKTPEEVDNQRKSVNSEYINRLRQSCRDVPCLGAQEEKKLVDHYQLVLMDVATKYQPPIPNTPVATAVTYMKRFYLKTSVMDHPPREMYLVFLYMACKVEEYNITADKFVCILPADRREKCLDFILSHELLLMQQLDFHMTVYNPYRPMEGFIIDMKTRLSINPDPWRSKAEYYVSLLLHTDACFYYPPSQLALAALNYGCDNGKVEKYILQALGGGDKNQQLIGQVRNIVTLVNSKQQSLTKDQVKLLEQKLKACRNPENNPAESKAAKRKKMDKKSDDSVIPEKRMATEMDIN